MKFLFLSYSVNVGGLEMYILRFARWLRRQHTEHELTLICKAGQLGSLEANFCQAGVKLIPMPLGYMSPLQYKRFYNFLIKENEYHAVCDFCGNFGGIPVLVSKLADVSNRLVFYRSTRESYSPTLYRTLYQRLMNDLVRRYSTNILSNSKEAFDYFFKGQPVLQDHRFKVIRNGIPQPQSLLSNEQKSTIRKDVAKISEQKIVLHVGSGRNQKNHACIFEIAKLAQDNRDNICFCFAGRNVEGKYKIRVDHLQLKNIRFLGERKDVGDLLQIADFFLFPSLSEGHPNALLEAMSSGVPFIASNISPIRELLPSGWGNRWLFSPDKPEEGYAILQTHLKNDLRDDRQFKSLVTWCRNEFNENERFGEFLECLTNTKC